jgi:hypothetical protein
MAQETHLLIYIQNGYRTEEAYVLAVYCGVCHSLMHLLSYTLTYQPIAPRARHAPHALLASQDPALPQQSTLELQALEAAVHARACPRPGHTAAV